MHNSSAQIAKQEIPNFNAFFKSLNDPRRTHKGNFFYPLDEILFLTISAVISGAEGWTMIQEFGNAKLDWLRKFFPYAEGILSHDVLGRLFSKLDHKEFSDCFSNWINSISNFTDGQVIAIDGKTIRKSNKRSHSKAALHIVSAYASANRLCIGQEVVDEKSNEITAIPKLLEVIEIKGCIVTIDAMGCQKQIAKDILKQKADYLLMVKGNQLGLKEQVEKLFQQGDIFDTYTDVDSGHGRIETRTCQVITNLRFLDDKNQWPGFKSIVRISTKRLASKTGLVLNDLRPQKY